jgi:Bacterial SH3 domain.
MKKDSKKLEGVLLSSIVTLTSVSAATNISKAYSLSANQTATTTARLNMRSTSSILGKILLTLKQGTKIEVIKKLGQWLV